MIYHSEFGKQWITPNIREQHPTIPNAKQENSVLEDQFSHLNDALKECMRDLQQAKEEQE